MLGALLVLGCTLTPMGKRWPLQASACVFQSNLKSTKSHEMSLCSDALDFHPLGSLHSFLAPARVEGPMSPALLSPWNSGTYWGCRAEKGKLGLTLPPPAGRVAVGQMLPSPSFFFKTTNQEKENGCQQPGILNSSQLHRKVSFWY